MPQTSELARLAERRQHLVQESARLRSQMAEACGQVKASLAWVERGLAVVQTGRALWPVVAGATGLLVASKGGGWLRTARRVWSWWRLGQRALALWYSFQGQDKQDPTRTG